MKKEIDRQTLLREIAHLPPTARRRAERELGLPVSDSGNEHRVFVYGTLLAGQANARCAKPLRRHHAWTQGTLYDTGRGYPAFTKDGDTKVSGELLAVNDESLAAMDRLEGYPSHYRREEITVYTVHGRFKAWVYIMNKLPDGATVINGGDWRGRARG